MKTLVAVSKASRQPSDHNDDRTHALSILGRCRATREVAQ
jgi:hypothetical protein